MVKFKLCTIDKDMPYIKYACWKYVMDRSVLFKLHSIFKQCVCIERIFHPISISSDRNRRFMCTYLGRDAEIGFMLSSAHTELIYKQCSSREAHSIRSGPDLNQSSHREQKEQMWEVPQCSYVQNPSSLKHASSETKHLLNMLLV